MLDIKYIKDNKEAVKKAVIDKQLSGSVDIDKLLTIYDEYLSLLKRVETHRGLRNTLSKDMSKVTADAREKLLDEAKRVKEELTVAEKELDVAKNSLDEELLKVPNMYSDDTPVGKDDSENKVLSQHGKVPTFDFTPKDHMELGVALDIIDTETAGRVSGSRFAYLKNEAVLLQFALIQFCLKTVLDKKIMAELAKKAGSPYDTPFVPVVPPVFIKPQIMKRMDRLDPIDERYYIQSDDQVLVGSAEHTLGPMVMDTTLDTQKLPLRLVGYSTAFRREAGSYGKDIKGIFRLHQFDKLEMESFASIEDGASEQALFVEIQKYLLDSLKLPYQVVISCTGDMGKPDFRHIDMECWLPAQEKYRETHTSDYMTDYQSRRLNAGYKDKDGNRNYLYMNDATLCAVGRTLIAIIENYQQKDGSIVVPEVLRPYTGFDRISQS